MNYKPKTDRQQTSQQLLKTKKATVASRLLQPKNEPTYILLHFLAS